ncbi:Rrf2 family transcriptional regulator [Bacteroides heparinolyticus]|uniref:Rrf2 family transcriptional regulator n=1 Tax=Prevotella heparinolytica TaxID=28113 RepID=UPI00359F33C4
MDTRFSSAIHTLIMIAGSEEPITSERIAESVGTNASYIRKVTGLLKKKGIIESRQGISGFTLLVAPEDLTLLRVYQAIAESEQVHVFDLHQNPNDECIVGQHIRPVLTDVFREIEEKAELELKNTTLADCMKKMRIEIDKENAQ